MSERDALLARIDQRAAQLLALVLEVRLLIEHDALRPEIDAGYTAGYHVAAADPSRWVDIGSDHLQQGFMALRRAVHPERRF
ncbi:MAG: hypothetical protein O9345_16205 [Burkholderiaceae bacterium]|nr:hypothetical protein [Burkholderiales bacterium]MCZ8339669.1 hypothetical protein [Burkholderiaceae bacterium]